jgi:hypothetical protein
LTFKRKESCAINLGEKKRKEKKRKEKKRKEKKRKEKFRIFHDYYVLRVMEISLIKSKTSSQSGRQ